jgi:PTS system N-acetylglucosamine-specific IIC component
MTGLAMVTMDLLNVKLGFTFSAGLLDYALNFSKATRPLLLLPVGLLWFVVYYAIFRWAIVRFDITTPGREADVAPVAEDGPVERGAGFVAALGGAANLTSIDACTTRLRLTIRDPAKVDEPRLRRLGARGFVRPAPGGLQIVLGPVADMVAVEMRRAAGPLDTAPLLDAVGSAPAAVDATLAAGWLAALGGRHNLVEIAANPSRLMLRVADASLVDAAALRRLGVVASAIPSAGAIHLLVDDAKPIARALAG